MRVTDISSGLQRAQKMAALLSLNMIVPLDMLQKMRDQCLATAAVAAQIDVDRNGRLLGDERMLAQ
jgi:hypothetical protein